jgi:hypothetical protein
MTAVTAGNVDCVQRREAVSRDAFMQYAYTYLLGAGLCT